MQNNVMPNNVTEFSTYEEIVAKQKSIETQNEGMIRNIINQISCSMTDEKSFLEFTKQIKDYRNNIFKAKLGVNDINSAYMKREKNTPDQTLEMLNSRTILSGLSVKNFIYGYKMPQRVFNRAIEKIIYPMQALTELLVEDCHDSASLLHEGNYYENESNYIYLQIKSQSKEYSGYRKNFLNKITECPPNSESLSYKVIAEKLENINPDIVTERLKKDYYGVYDDLYIERKEQDCIRRVNIMGMNKVLEYYSKELEYWDKTLINQKEKKSDREYGELE